MTKLDHEKLNDKIRGAKDYAYEKSLERGCKSWIHSFAHQRPKSERRLSVAQNNSLIATKKNLERLSEQGDVVDDLSMEDMLEDGVYLKAKLVYEGHIEPDAAPVDDVIKALCRLVGQWKCSMPKNLSMEALEWVEDLPFDFKTIKKIAIDSYKTKPTTKRRAGEIMRARKKELIKKHIDTHRR